MTSDWRELEAQASKLEAEARRLEAQGDEFGADARRLEAEGVRLAMAAARAEWEAQRDRAVDTLPTLDDPDVPVDTSTDGALGVRPYGPLAESALKAAAEAEAARPDVLVRVGDVLVPGSEAADKIEAQYRDWYGLDDPEDPGDLQEVVDVQTENAYRVRIQSGAWADFHWVSGWELPGQGPSRDSCMRFILAGCVGTGRAADENYEQCDIHADVIHDLNKKDYAQCMLMSCKRLECAKCLKPTVDRMGGRAADRTVAYWVKLGSHLSDVRVKRIGNHVTAAPKRSEWDRLRDPRELKKEAAKARRLLKELGFEGGVQVFHPYRFTEKLGRPYWAPHWHHVCTGYADPDKMWATGKDAGVLLWSLSTFTDAKAANGVLRYLLTHAGVQNNKGRRNGDVIRYWGECSNNKFATSSFLCNTSERPKLLAAAEAELSGGRKNAVESLESYAYQIVQGPLSGDNFDIKQAKYGPITHGASVPDLEQIYRSGRAADAPKMIDNLAKAASTKSPTLATDQWVWNKAKGAFDVAPAGAPPPSPELPLITDADCRQDADPSVMDPDVRAVHVLDSGVAYVLERAAYRDAISAKLTVRFSVKKMDTSIRVLCPVCARIQRPLLPIDRGKSLVDLGLTEDKLAARFPRGGFEYMTLQDREDGLYYYTLDGGVARDIGLPSPNAYSDAMPRAATLDVLQARAGAYLRWAARKVRRKYWQAIAEGEDADSLIAWHVRAKLGKHLGRLASGLSDADARACTSYFRGLVLDLERGARPVRRTSPSRGQARLM